MKYLQTLLIILSILHSRSAELSDSFKVMIKKQDSFCFSEFIFKDTTFQVDIKLLNFFDNVNFQVTASHFQYSHNKQNFQKGEGYKFDGNQHNYHYSKKFVPRGQNGEYYTVCIANLNQKDEQSIQVNIELKEIIGQLDLSIASHLRLKTMDYIVKLSEQISSVSEYINRIENQKSLQELTEFEYKGNLSKNVQFFGFVSILMFIFLSIFMVLIVQSYFRRKKLI